MSLQRRLLGSYGNEPLNWVACSPTSCIRNCLSDTDGDGLPDDWELASGLNPHSAAGDDGASGDPDGDRFTNLQEYLAGTDPQNSQDVLRFDSISLSNLVCRLQFNTHTGRTYAVERLNAFGPTNTWVAFTNFTPSINGPVTVSDPQAPAGSFYRLKVTRN